jgi:hypothetical protein
MGVKKQAIVLSGAKLVFVFGNKGDVVRGPLPARHSVEAGFQERSQSHEIGRTTGAKRVSGSTAFGQCQALHWSRRNRHFRWASTGSKISPILIVSFVARL